MLDMYTYHHSYLLIHIYTVYHHTQYLSYSKEIVCDDILYKYELVNMNDDMYTYQAYATTDNFTIIIEYRAFFDEFTTFIDQLY